MHRLLVIAATALAAVHCMGAELTPAEAHWLRVSAPVLEYARHQRMPLEVRFDHHPEPGDSPVSMGFEGGRCQLVYAIRGNPDADAALAAVEPEIASPVIEAMVAHELGHCWRHVRGAWHTVPAGFVERRDPDRDRTRARLRRDMRLARLEEGYADLVGLAWTLRQHPQRYARVHEWLARMRGMHAVPGAPHDTAAWVGLAADPSAFPPAETPFEQALTLWRNGVPASD